MKGRWHALLWSFVATLVLFGVFVRIRPAFATDLVVDNDESDCQHFELNQDLYVFTDPKVSLKDFGSSSMDRTTREKLFKDSNLILTVFKGPVDLLIAGEPRPFRGFDTVARYFDLLPADRPTADRDFLSALSYASGQGAALLIPIKICKPLAYNDFVGFVLKSNLDKARMASVDSQRLPPSTRGNPIPKPVFRD